MLIVVVTRAEGSSSETPSFGKLGMDIYCLIFTVYSQPRHTLPLIVLHLNTVEKLPSMQIEGLPAAEARHAHWHCLTTTPTATRRFQGRRRP